MDTRDRRKLSEDHLPRRLRRPPRLQRNDGESDDVDLQGPHQADKTSQLFIADFALKATP